jgi:hypothetical protein
MLARKFGVFFGLVAFTGAAALEACVITEGPTGSTGSGGATSAATTDAATTGTGSTTATTGVGGGTATTAATTGTGTGGSACIGDMGKGVVGDCDKMNITPSSHGGGAASICGMNLDEDPPGYGLCTRGFTIFTTGAATDLQTCLAAIGVQDECKTDPLQVCVDTMFKDACISADIQTSCDGIKTTCGTDPFDSAKCAKDMNPFSNAGLMEVETCINMTDPSVACQKAYDDCYATTMSF